MKKFICFLILLAAFFFGFYLKSTIETQRRYKILKTKYDIANYVKAIELFKKEKKTLPKNLKELFSKKGFIETEIKIKKRLKDPWKKPYYYKTVGKDFLIISNGSKKEVKNFFITNKNIIPQELETYKLKTKEKLNKIYTEVIKLSIFAVVLVLLIIFSLRKVKKASYSNKDIFNDVLKNVLSLISRDDMRPAVALHNITKQISRLFPTLRCAFLIIKEEDVYSVASQDNEDYREFKLNIDNYPELKLMSTRGHTVILDQLDTINKDNVLKHVNEFIKDIGIKAILIEPIIKNKKIVGALFVRTSSNKRTFSSEEIEICKIISKCSLKTLEQHTKFKELYS